MDEVPVDLKALPVVDGLLIAYIALGVMAVIPIYFGSFASLKFKKAGKVANGIAAPLLPVEDDEEVEFFSLEDAKMFPILGSATLFSLYLLFTYFDKAYVNVVLTGQITINNQEFATYFALLGVGALTKSGLAIARKATGWELKGDYRLEMFKQHKEILSFHFGIFHCVLLASSIVIGAYYAMTKQWIVSNMYGEALATSAVTMLNLDSFLTGIALLVGLFFYDIFWVFGTDVMVTVAKSFDAPIKVVFPKDIVALITTGVAKGNEFTMLGLGDIVIPGIFVALCLRFDQYNYEQTQNGRKNPRSTAFPKPYFTACFVAYAIGLVTTVAVMHTTKTAQPALLYLSPACTLSVLLTALIRGELKQLWAYSPDKDVVKKSDKADKKAGGAAKVAASASSSRKKPTTTTIEDTEDEEDDEEGDIKPEETEINETRTTRRSTRSMNSTAASKSTTAGGGAASRKSKRSRKEKSYSE
ncbi:hypothetical protein SmJEL517_g02726 [Synchytrium microbalum]|uniref:Peptidase A22B, signal peptide peptidase n=1 Tax=Synchytrium microbalum TaxID=1806994 RepID=A0A507C5K5_9FUNG|nr:uncharacterized protein SmJEL517_g02726 [Synchytrium microbalum]TPX34658.1 hypothetical protein SmJEL517_g02726 [Synchytrium microbalum]